uniref:Minor capsid protein L2 n=1 Tax=Human papillomavirus TaxID=10566 RepID=A0A385PJK4_9PAPI|nr:MAG: L2 protein [Human papillomavirus]
MESQRRRKRAAPEQLYKHCLQGGDCIPDVQNKYEQRTWADILLKVFGSLLYFGNLGIGTGRGSGGSLGYKPLGSPDIAGRPAPITPARPSILIDAVGPPDIVTIDAAAPSVVPLSEGTVDIGLVTPDAGPGNGVEELELYTITNPTTDVGGVQPTPTIVSSEEGATAIIDAQPIPERPVQVYFDPSPSATTTVNIFPAMPTTSTDVNVFVDSFDSNVIGGFDEIPLQRLNYEEFNIADIPEASTPVQKVEAALSRAKNLYSRYFRQVPVRSSTFLRQPSKLVQFEFDNPAFDAEISLQFERDLAQVAASPDEDFADVITLHKPQLSSFQGRVRVSRVGDTATITTRSGTVIGQPIHFFHDLSNITNAEAFEMQVLNEHGGLSTIVDDLVTNTVIDSLINTDVAITENDILDPLNEDFTNTQIVLQLAEETEDNILIPVGSNDSIVKAFTPDIGGGFYTSSSIIDSIQNTVSLYDLTSAINTGDAFDFFLHPGLLPKKRRRLRLY